MWAFLLWNVCLQPFLKRNTPVSIPQINMDSQTSPVFCTKCGAQAPAGASFCSQCGNRLLDEVAPSPLQAAAISSVEAGKQSSVAPAQPPPATTTDPLHQSATSSPVLPFAWLPRSRAGAIFVALVFVFVLCISSSGFFGALFEAGLTFLVITGIRYGWYLLPARMTDQTFAIFKPKKNKYIILIGACFVFLLLIIFVQHLQNTASNQVIKVLGDGLSDAYKNGVR